MAPLERRSTLGDDTARALEYGVAGSSGCRWRHLKTSSPMTLPRHMTRTSACSVQLERGRLLRLCRPRCRPRHNRQCAAGKHKMEQHHHVYGDQIHHQPQARHGPRPQHARRRRRRRVHRAQRPAHRAGRVLKPARVSQRAKPVRGFDTVREIGRGRLQIVSVPAADDAGGGGRVRLRRSPAKALRGGGVRRVQRLGQLWGGETSRVRFPPSESEVEGGV